MEGNREAFRTSSQRFSTPSNLSLPGNWSTAHSARSTPSMEASYSTGNKYLALVYQIDIGIIRLRWVATGANHSFQGFCTAMGQEVISLPHGIIPEKCSEALHIHAASISSPKWTKVAPKGARAPRSGPRRTLAGCCCNAVIMSLTSSIPTRICSAIT